MISAESSDTGCCAPRASSLLGTTNNMENNDISGEKVGELSWALALFMERVLLLAESTLTVLSLVSVQCTHRRRIERTNNTGQI